MTRIHRFGGSLLARLLLGYLMVAAVFAAAWLWSLYGPLTDAALRQQQRNLTAVAQSAALVAAESDADVVLLSRQLVARTDLRLTIVAGSGDVIADSNADAATMANHADRPEIAQALKGETGVARRVSSTEGIEELYVAVPASLHGERVALRVAQPLSEIEAIAASSRQFGLGLLTVALLLAVAVSFAAARAASTPVRQLTHAARLMAAGDLGVAVPEMPSDLTELAHSLSELRSQVQARLQALDTERRSLRSTLDGLADAVLVVEDGVVRLANRGADRMFRAPSGGWENASLDSANLPSSLTEALRDIDIRGGAQAVELPPDPTGRTLRVVVAPLEGEPSARSIVVISDVTERARLDRVRRDFVANASHELKTPTSGIKLLAEAANVAAADGDTEQSLAFTRQIEAEAERLRHLVGDLLDLSRLESTASRDAMADVRGAVERAVLSHRAAAGRKGLELRVNADTVRGGDVYVRGDETDLAIALDNLLDNAIAYTEHGSVTVDVSVAEDTVRITIADTGPGIPAEHRDRVFERFYRVDGGRSRDAGGTGLGLALVRHVAERSGGSVTLDSAAGQGAKFTLALERVR